jgi:hypothetical protein
MHVYVAEEENKNLILSDSSDKYGVENYKNYIKKIKKKCINFKNWSETDDNLLKRLFRNYGNKWKIIAKYFPSRTPYQLSYRIKTLGEKQEEKNYQEKKSSFDKNFMEKELITNFPNFQFRNINDHLPNKVKEIKDSLNNQTHNQLINHINIHDKFKKNENENKSESESESYEDEDENLNPCLNFALKNFYSSYDSCFNFDFENVETSFFKKIHYIKSTFKFHAKNLKNFKAYKFSAYDINNANANASDYKKTEGVAAPSFSFLLNNESNSSISHLPLNIGLSLNENENINENVNENKNQLFSKENFIRNLMDLINIIKLLITKYYEEDKNHHLNILLKNVEKAYSRLIE